MQQHTHVLHSINMLQKETSLYAHATLLQLCRWVTFLLVICVYSHWYTSLCADGGEYVCHLKWIFQLNQRVNRNILLKEVTLSTISSAARVKRVCFQLYQIDKTLLNFNLHTLSWKPQAKWEMYLSNITFISLPWEYILHASWFLKTVTTIQYHCKGAFYFSLTTYVSTLIFPTQIKSGHSASLTF